MTEKLRKNKNHYNNGGYERTNEFRKLQEESRRLSLTLSRQERVNAFDENLRKRVERFCDKKMNTSIAGTLILQGY